MFSFKDPISLFVIFRQFCNKILSTNDERTTFSLLYTHLYGVGVSRYPIGPYPDSASTFPFEVQRVQGINDVLERILELTNDMFEKFSEVRGEILHWV